MKLNIKQQLRLLFLALVLVLPMSAAASLETFCTPIAFPTQDDYQSSLVMAIELNSLRLVMAAVRYGAMPGLPDADGQIPLEKACSIETIDERIIKFLRASLAMAVVKDFESRAEVKKVLAKYPEGYFLSATDVAFERAQQELYALIKQ